MKSDAGLDRYRRWYRRLLHLYPMAFRERFAEPMEHTFADLARDRRLANSGLIGFFFATFAETSTGIIRENLATMTTHPMNYLRWILVTAAVLLVPFLAMQLNLDEGVNWGPMDFAVMGVLVLGSGLLFEYASSRTHDLAQKAAVAIAVGSALFLVWVNLAVGMMDVENGNLMYVAVLFLALVGAAVGRFEPRDASIAMFATAAAHALVAIIALVAGLAPTLPADAFFIAAWVASALLFRQASASSDAGMRES